MTDTDHFGHAEFEIDRAGYVADTSEAQICLTRAPVHATLALTLAVGRNGRTP
jgi:hypothetical protein